MAWMGVRVSLYPARSKTEKNRHRVWFLVLGVIAAMLTIAQGIRNEISQKELLDQIAKNKPTITVQPAPVTVNNIPAPPVPSVTSTPKGPAWKWERSQPFTTASGSYVAAAALIIANTTLSDLSFKLKCDIPCIYDAGGSIEFDNYSGVIAHQMPAPDPTIIWVKVSKPGILEKGKSVLIAVKSQGGSQPTILSVNELKPSF